MIELENISFSYNNAECETGIQDISLVIPSGQVVLLCGESGCGKSTLTRVINKLAPEYYEGRLSGKLKIDGVDVTHQPIYSFDGKIGTVFQNPRSQFFNVDTTSEIAFGCENYGVEKTEILERIDQAVEEMKIEALIGRSLFALSGGEKQKVACASVSAMHPDIFILDEPSSNLDISTIGDLKKAIKHWKSQGKTIIIAEHRIYYLMEVADRVIYMKDGRIESDMSIESFKMLSDKQLHSKGLRTSHPINFENTKTQTLSDKKLILKDFSFCYGKRKVTDIPYATCPQGAIVAILGHNGAGKTTFAKCLCGLEKSAKGTVELDKMSYKSKKRMEMSYMVMQDVNYQLFTESVLDEIMLSMPGEDEIKEEEEAKEILEGLNLSNVIALHPMSLSGGQKQRVAIGSAIASNKEIILFDEPTSGLDYKHMLEVADNLRQLSSLGKTIFIITHDPELVAQCCNYFMFIDKGQVAWSGGWNNQNKKRILDFFTSNN